MSERTSERTMDWERKAREELMLRIHANTDDGFGQLLEDKFGIGIKERDLNTLSAGQLIEIADFLDEVMIDI